jgi:hypothetical protein
MSLQSVMLEQLAAARRIVRDGYEVCPHGGSPVWQIACQEGDRLILTQVQAMPA